MGLRLTFDDPGVDALSQDTVRTMPFRLALAAATGLLLAANLGWATGMVWAAAGLSVEGWSFFVNRRVALPLTARQRGIRVAGAFALSAVWTLAAILYWRTGDRAFQLVAIIQLASLLAVAQNISFQSLVMSLGVGLLPAIAFVALPLCLGGFTGLPFFTLTMCVGLALLYVVVDSREGAGHAGALRDAKAALEAETLRATAASEAKSAFLAMMSHELRTPLNGVLGMARALSATRLDLQQAEQASMLVRSGEGLLTILNDILDISKIEAGRLELEAIPFDLPEVATRVRDLWRVPAEEKGVDFELAIDAATPRWVLGDPTRLHQVITNLVSNALKFTSRGAVRLAIRPLEISATSARVEIAVADSGIGMNAAQTERVFESFTQADASTTRRFGGSGLGLSICRDLVTRMGGAIVAESIEGEGSTFRVTVEWPLAEAPRGAADTNPAGDLAGWRVLVADDHVVNQMVARSILEASGATVATAGDGAEALARLTEADFDIVLMDVHMPTMDGVEAVRRLRAGEAGRRDTPVIALTGDAMAGVDAELLAKGFDAVEPKPIRLESLLGAILATRAGTSEHPALADAG
jgi:signal transduction histidine kinase/CheY-like chemotaxis protein